MPKIDPTLPIVTVKMLRDSLALLGSAYDDMPVTAWLPGSYVQLSSTIFPRGGAVLIEANITPDSVLAVEP